MTEDEFKEEIRKIGFEPYGGGGIQERGTFTYVTLAWRAAQQSKETTVCQDTHLTIEKKVYILRHTSAVSEQVAQLERTISG